MRNQQQQFNKSNNKQYHEYEHEDITVMKLNQALPPQASFLLFFLILLALFANATRGYDYNVVIGCGVYFLSSKNPFLHKMIYFYLLVGLTICADALVIVLLYGKVDMFHSMIVPGVEIVLKIFLLIVQGLYWRKENEEEKLRQTRKSQQNANLMKQLQQQKRLEKSKLLYQQQKLEQKPNPASYYKPKYNFPSNINTIDKQIYKTRQYREFDNQQFVNQSGQNQIQSKSRRN